MQNIVRQLRSDERYTKRRIKQGTAQNKAVGRNCSTEGFIVEVTEREIVSITSE